MGGRCERIAGTEQLMGWHREGVQLARTENNATHWVPPGGKRFWFCCLEEKRLGRGGRWRGGRREGCGSKSQAQGG